MGPKKYFQNFLLQWYLGPGGLFRMLLKNIDFQAKSSHFLDICSKQPEMTYFIIIITMRLHPHGLFYERCLGVNNALQFFLSEK